MSRLESLRVSLGVFRKLEAEFARSLAHLRSGTHSRAGDTSEVYQPPNVGKDQECIHKRGIHD